MMTWIKEYWFLIVFMSVAFGIYVEWRVQETTKTTVDGVEFVSPAALTALETALTARSELVDTKLDGLEKNADKLDSKIERIVDILLEP